MTKKGIRQTFSVYRENYFEHLWNKDTPIKRSPKMGICQDPISAINHELINTKDIADLKSSV
jgi:hypothetical protein